MKKKRLPGLYPKVYPLLAECVEDGLRGGFWNELPESWPEIDQARVEDLTEKFSNRILNEICERFDFGDEFA